MMNISNWLGNAVDRRGFMGTAAVGMAAMLTPQVLRAEMVADSTANKEKKPAKAKGPRVDDALVKEFVRVSHFDLEAVRQMLTETPQLLNVSWDWGGGDFEAGIEAASHVGNRDIAFYFMSQGARANLFTATMLGQTEIVKGFMTNYPYMIHSRGPHGLGLVHHAKKGGEEAVGVLAYLESLGIQ